MARGKQIVGVLATLAVAFGVALVLNWGILGQLDQYRSGGRHWLGVHGLLCLITPSSRSLRVAEP